MQEILVTQSKLTQLQENVLIELYKTVNSPSICKKLGIKPITLTKAIQALNEKEMLFNMEVTEKGKIEAKLIKNEKTKCYYYVIINFGFYICTDVLFSRDNLNNYIF